MNMQPLDLSQSNFKLSLLPSIVVQVLRKKERKYDYQSAGFPDQLVSLIVWFLRSAGFPDRLVSLVGWFP